MKPRAHGLFDRLAVKLVNGADGSTTRLFMLVYSTGVVVTTFLSNDATAAVLTPAVFTVARKADAKALPLLLACALIANAASFMLPISNPANLVLYGGHMPPLGQWFASFALPSIAAIVVTCVFLWLLERNNLSGSCNTNIASEPLSRGGLLAMGRIVLTAILLLVVSLLDRPLGLPTTIAGIATALIVSAFARRNPFELARDVSWGVLPLVGGLFVLVQGLAQTGVIGMIAGALKGMADPSRGAALGGTILAFASNLADNLPAGLVASEAVVQAHPYRLVVDGLLIGVDLGPNLSVTGSLATILWLQAIRREGEHIGFWRFLMVGIVVMPTALAAALGARLLLS